MTANRILVVDDEELNRDVCVRRLERHGFTVEAACSGQEALDILRRQSYDLILLDQMMPGLSGLDLLKYLRQTWSQQDLPIIMVTAVTDSMNVAKALDEGANDYITKPVDFSIAMARIRSQLSRKRTEAALRRSEERYALAARGANDGLWDWDLEKGQIFYSPRWKEMIGFHENELSSKPEEWTSRVHESDRVKFEEMLRSHLEGTSEALECEYRMRHRDGTYRWMSCRAMTVRNEAGKSMRMVGSQSDITQRITRDSLTGLGNRVLFEDRMAGALEQFQRNPESGFAVLYLDVDRFKIINDSLGHAAGDSLLREIAIRLRESVRDEEDSTRVGYDVICRLGGDEFAILLHGIRNQEMAEKTCARLARNMKPIFKLADSEIYCSISIGVVTVSQRHLTAAALLQDADTAMYAAKASGCGHWAVFEPAMQDRVRRRLQIETDLRHALENGELCVFYQPRVLLSTGEIQGFEALVRWQHPTRGLIYPDEFISIAEETGLIVPIGMWVLRTACEQMQIWHHRYPHMPPLDIAVNLSVRQCHEPNLVEEIHKALSETGLPAHSLNLELTESLLFENMEAAKDLLCSLKKLGVGLKMDDFGTGYSCLRYLSDLPFDTLKIDRSFTSQLDFDNPDDTEDSVIRTIVAMAEGLKLGVIAEGVESEAHAKHLMQIGCQYGQGYFYSKPIDSAGTEQLLANQMAKRSSTPLPESDSR